MKNFDISIYDERYFLWHKNNTEKYIKTSTEILINLLKPKSIIDFGCGIGYTLETAFNMGIRDLVGIEISLIAKKYTNEKIKNLIINADCSEILETKKYDLVICTEVFEHIEPKNSENLLKNITNSLNKDGTIIFSAAPIGQNGSGHINLKSKEYFINFFKSYNIVEDKEILSIILNSWNKINVPNYICNNLLVFKYEK